MQLPGMCATLGSVALNSILSEWSLTGYHILSLRDLGAACLALQDEVTVVIIDSTSGIITQTSQHTTLCIYTVLI